MIGGHFADQIEPVENEFSSEVVNKSLIANVDRGWAQPKGN